jgi:hypothetical protein
VTLNSIFSVLHGFLIGSFIIYPRLGGGLIFERGHGRPKCTNINLDTSSTLGDLGFKLISLFEVEMSEVVLNLT